MSHVYSLARKFVVLARRSLAAANVTSQLHCFRSFCRELFRPLLKITPGDCTTAENARTTAAGAV